MFSKLKKIFFGWWMVIAGGIISLIGTGVCHHGFSVFFKPLAAELSLNRTVTSIAPSIQMSVNGLISPVGGILSDKYGPRLVMMIGVIILIIGCVLMFFVNSLWTFLLAWGIFIGIGGSLGVTMMTDRAVINWFVKKSGVAINTKFAIQSLAGITVLPLIAWLVLHQGWRMTMIFSAIAVAVTCVPLIWFFMKPHAPEHYGLLPDGDSASDVKKIDDNKIDEIDTEPFNFTVKEVFKTSTFWMLILVQSGFTLVMPMIGPHAVPFLTDQNINVVEAAAILGLLQTTSIPARAVTGFFMDRFPLKYFKFIMAMGYFVEGIGTFIYILYGSVYSIYIWFILFGIGMGISSSIIFPLVARYFGRRYFGSIIGIWSAIPMPIMLAGPIFVGWIYDTTGSYRGIIYLMVIMIFSCGILSCFVLPPKKSVVKAAIPEQSKLALN